MDINGERKRWIPTQTNPDVGIGSPPHWPEYGPFRDEPRFTKSIF